MQSQNAMQLSSAQAMYQVINNPMANAVINNNNNDLKQSLSQMNSENQQLRRKLNNKNNECEKLKIKVKEAKDECEQYKHLMNQLSQSVNSLQNGNSLNLSINSGMSGVSGVVAMASTSGSGKRKRSSKSEQSFSQCCCCDTEKRYVCQFENCGKRFRQKPHLDAHQNIHTGRRFACDWPQCGKSFVRKYNLVEHQKLHSSLNPNMCDFPNCGKCFSSRYSLSRHQNAQHNQALQSADQRRQMLLNSDQ